MTRQEADKDVHVEEAKLAILDEQRRDILKAYSEQESRVMQARRRKVREAER